MTEVPLLNVLEKIEENELVTRKGLEKILNDSRYCKGYLDVLEELEFIKIRKFGTSKLHRLTQKGEKLLDKLLKENYGTIKIDK